MNRSMISGAPHRRLGCAMSALAANIALLDVTASPPTAVARTDFDGMLNVDDRSPDVMSIGNDALMDTCSLGGGASASAVITNVVGASSAMKGKAPAGSRCAHPPLGQGNAGKKIRSAVALH